MYGWMGKVLRVNLTDREIKEENLDPEVAKDYLGGRGLGMYYLNREMDATCDPLSPENLLILATGPLTGTTAPTGGRYMVVAKSPLTGAVTGSNSGGKFPKEFKKTGYDAIVFSGAAKGPLYLWIGKGKAELRDATHVWGKTVNETTDILLSETEPKAKVACIGPAGENKVLFAAVMNDKDRAAARSGVGAVMGSKNLKAVVVRGEKKVKLADPDKFKELRSSVLKKYKDMNQGNPPVLRQFGTAHGVAGNQSVGSLPTRNFQQGTFEGWEKVSAQVLTDQFLQKPHYCADCPIGCGRGTKVEDPEFQGEGEGPEYESIFALGPVCGNDNMASVIKANYVANDLGLDTISMGVTLACAMELYQRGHLTEEETGEPLDWGDAKTIVKMVENTGYRRGFGDRLAEGSYRLADSCGHPEYAMVSKKQELAGYEPRTIQGMGLAEATSPIGGSHMRAQTAYFELFGVPKVIGPTGIEDKARLVRIWQDMTGIIDCTGVCYFFAVRCFVDPVLEVTPTGFTEFLNAATGADYTVEEVRMAGERVFNAERLFLANAGLSRKDDTLPKRQLEEPMPDGPNKGALSRLPEMLDDYYEFRGWTKEGIPSDEKLEELGLK